jgi:hypothetical protein
MWSSTRPRIVAPNDGVRRPVGAGAAALDLPATASAVPGELRRATKQNDTGVLREAVPAAKGTITGAATTAPSDLVRTSCITQW